MKSITKATEQYNTVLSDRELSRIVGGNKKPLQSSLSISFEQIKTKSKTTTIIDVAYSGSTLGLLGLAVILRSAIKGGSPGAVYIND